MTLHQVCDEMKFQKCPIPQKTLLEKCLPLPSVEIIWRFAPKYRFLSFLSVGNVVLNLIFLKKTFEKALLIIISIYPYTFSVVIYQNIGTGTNRYSIHFSLNNVVSWDWTSYSAPYCREENWQTLFRNIKWFTCCLLSYKYLICC